ncbi:MAG TPA: methylated-DNA--[protein]-cysteine S-methyltransferase [Gemmatimonadaceae bacterium]|nr:methylated-DNA--[protein]-cysteine S-methyltransferase [Gemmatimonadaceae bacterium]
MEITYTTGDCRLGRLLIASTSKGICRIMMGTSDHELERELTSRFPTATVKRDDRGLATALAGVAGRVAGRRLDHPMPLDLKGTTFQKQVWNEMLRIPPGNTRSYGDLAKRIGRPKSSRAVAQACGANPIPIVVPCHRVIAASGKLGGYTGGLDRKLALLEAEGVSNPSWEPEKN